MEIQATQKEALTKEINYCYQIIEKINSILIERKNLPIFYLEEIVEKMRDINLELNGIYKTLRIKKSSYSDDYEYKP